MKIELTLRLDKKTIKTFMEEAVAELMKASNKRSMSAKKGWDTRRKRRQKAAVAVYKQRKKAGKAKK